MDPPKYTRKTKETLHKPYRSDATSYQAHRAEIPDASYGFGSKKHSEFKKPWLPHSGYDAMEYRWDFPLAYLNPIHMDIDVPDMGQYIYPNIPDWNPDWKPPRWDPRYPTPTFPDGNDFKLDGPGDENQASRIKWMYCEGHDFYFCPGTLIRVTFTQFRTDPIRRVMFDPKYGLLLKAESIWRAPYNPEGLYLVDIMLSSDIEEKSFSVFAETASGNQCESRGHHAGMDCMVCDNVSIGYTSTQQNVGTSQTLTVNNPVPGVTYEWEQSGGGSLSDRRGDSTTLTAPADNPNCTKNSTIYLKDKASGQICASLSVTYTNPNAGGGYKIWYQTESYKGGPYRSLYSNPPLCSNLYNSRHWNYNCAGEGQPEASSGALFCIDARFPCSDWIGTTTAGSLCDRMQDTRTDAQRLAGCCPQALM